MLPFLLLFLSKSIIYLYRNLSFIAVFTKADIPLAYLFLYNDPSQIFLTLCAHILPPDSPASQQLQQERQL